MLLRRMRAAGLRSIDKAELDSCGRFNVLIGKNNAGKSNVLSAILGFFNTFVNGEVLNLRPMFKDEDDFFDRDSKRPIEIICTFEVASGEVERVLTSMSDEFPTISNAMSQIQHTKFMRFTVKYFLRPSPFAILTKIGLNELDDDEHQAGYTTIYETSDDLAPQILERFSQANQKVEEIEFYSSVTRLDSGIFNAVKENERLSMRYYLDRVVSSSRITPTLVEAVEQLASQAPSYSDFQQLLNRKIAEVGAEITDIEMAPIAGTIYTFGGQQHFIPKYITQICKWLSEVKVLHQSERREPIDKADAQRLLSLRVRKGGDRLFQIFKASVSALIGVEVDAFEDTAPTNTGRRSAGEREAKLDVDNFLVQANGSGVREALRLMLDIELDEPNIMLIEEPEIHLHPALETSVMRYLKRKSDSSQIFLTTHSTNFIDSGEYSAIHFVRKDPSTISLLLTAEQAADVLPQELGLRLSSLFMYEKLVFVEGVSDEDVLREWASTIRCNFSRANVGFITLGGSRNIKHFAAAKTTEFLKNRGVELWFILDRDENTNEDIIKLRQALGTNCKLRILPVREIENYLAKPVALSKFVSRRIAQAKSELSDVAAQPSLVTSDEIAKVINECADSLHSFALGKALVRQVNSPIYVYPELLPSSSHTEILDAIKQNLAEGVASLSERSSRLEEIMSDFTAKFEEVWQSNKLLVVPGTELLEAILRHYKLAYRKQRDAKDIAALMETSEIPLEVSNMLQEIAPIE